MNHWVRRSLALGFRLKLFLLTLSLVPCLLMLTSPDARAVNCIGCATPPPCIGCNPNPTFIVPTATPTVTPTSTAPPKPGNLALHQPAQQSSHLAWLPPDQGGPEKAVDGNEDGNWFHNSVTHTDIDPPNGNWWMVDLGAMHHVKRIVLYNRTDGYQHRLSHYMIWTSPDYSDWSGHWELPVNQSDLVIADGDSHPHVYYVDIWARWVKVLKTDTDYMSLAEVEVFEN